MNDPDASCRIRDELAWRRTALANEHTLLAYARTALAMVAGGATMMKFFGGPAWTLTGVAICAGGILVGIIGAVRYGLVKRELARDSGRPSGR